MPASLPFDPRRGAAVLQKRLRDLRALTSKRSQLVEKRKRLLVHIRAHRKLGTAAMFENIDTALKARLDSLIMGIEVRIETATSRNTKLTEIAVVLSSIPGVGPVASTMLIAEMPELGAITSEEAAALAGLAPVAHDSGTLRGKRAISGGRRALRNVMFQAALVASHHNPTMKAFAESLRKPGKPHKVIITAVARKLVNLTNASCSNRQKWTPSAP